MAKFVKEGSKGAVGTLTKAEVLTTKSGERLDLSILKTEIPKDIDDLTSEIKDSHHNALAQVGRAIIAAARAGQLLIAAKAALPKSKNFTEWLAETFDFAQRTAYNYMTVSERVARRAPEIENCESIRDVLKLCDSEDATKKKTKDEKRETVVTYLLKLERWIADELSKEPLEEWTRERRDNLKKLFTPVARFHADL